MESSGAKRRRVCESLPKQCDIFLSHSGDEKPFVEQLYHDLKGMNQHAFFDQDSDCLPKAKKFGPEILEAAARCRVGVVVVSEGYLTSKWPMLELSKFVESKVKLFPLFFKLLPSDLKGMEVGTRWKKSWREMVERGEVKEEELELWSKAVKDLRSSNGLEYGKFSSSEYKYRAAVVKEICRLLPPKLEWSTSDIQGCDRLCTTASSMFQARTMGGDGDGHEYLGLYGMGGVGKTTLCKAMCAFYQGEFGGRVCYVELPSDQASEHVARDERVARLKLVVQRLGRFDKSLSDSVSTEEQGWQCLQDGLRDQQPVFLAIDNVGDYEASREEARNYVQRLPRGSKVLATARSREILKDVLGEVEYCKPIPRLQLEEAATLFLSKAAPKRSVSSLIPEEREIVERCLRECQFEDKGYPSREYHPLVLRGLGTYFHDVDSENVMRWGEALEDKNKLQRSREAKSVNDILGLNYRSLSDQVKLVFLDSAIYWQGSGYHQFSGHSWWLRGEEGDDLNLWVLWISEVHGVSPSEAKMMVKELQRLSLVEDSRVEVSVHDLYKEFARGLVEKEGSKEWGWWMSESSNDVTQLKRLVLDFDESILSRRTPGRFLEWRSLVFLELMGCYDIGPDLEVGSFTSLRALYVVDAPKLRRVVCNCNNGYNDGEYCYRRKPSRGCMSELLTLKIGGSDLEDLPILRHCWNLQHLEVNDWFSQSPTFPGSNGDSESVGVIDFRYLTALRVFAVCISCGDLLVFDCNEFIRWLLSGLQLKHLTVFDFYWMSDYRSGEDGGYMVDLNEASHLSPGLFVLALSLPKQIEEVKGLHLLSDVRILSLGWSRGLRQLPDLWCMPKLEKICVHGCCKLEAPPLLGLGVHSLGDNCKESDYIEHECLLPYCLEQDCSDCDERMNTYCFEDEDESEGLKFLEDKFWPKSLRRMKQI